ncbi:MAG TPA: hypothetical protein VD927_17925 [Chryseosolibacter sp.]|nr:hypothetical protein [Chryseosolibacter sp.]
MEALQRQPPTFRGVVALILDKKPGLHPNVVQGIIQASADKVNSDDIYQYDSDGFHKEMGYGRLNAGRAMEMLSCPWELQNYTAGPFSSTYTELETFSTQIDAPAYGLHYRPDARFLSDVYSVTMYKVTVTATLPKNFLKKYVFVRTGQETKGGTRIQAPSAENFFYLNDDGFAEVISINGNTVKFETFAYRVWDISTTPDQDKGWFPRHPNDITIAYTVLGIPGQIAGPSTICTTGSFEIIGQPANTDVTWSASTGLSIDPNTGIATKQSRYKGHVTVSATLTGQCGDRYPFSTTTWVGTPELPGAITGPTQLTPGMNATYWIEPPVRSNSYKWVIPSGCYYHYCWENLNQNQTMLSLQAGDPGYDAIEYKATNICGTNTRSLMVNVQNPYGGGGGGGDCGPSLSASPNPAKNGDVTVSIVYPPEPCDESQADFREVQNSLTLIDDDGTVLYKKSFKGSEVKLEKLKIQPGVYLIIVEHRSKNILSRLVID